MIFGGAEAYGDRHHLKATHHKVYAAEPVVPRYMWWSEFPIVFDHRDHPNRISHLGAYPLIIESIMGSKHLSKVLMDRVRGLIIMYIETFYNLGITRFAL